MSIRRCDNASKRLEWFKKRSQAKECRRPLNAGKDKEKDYPSELPEPALPTS